MWSMNARRNSAGSARFSSPAPLGRGSIFRCSSLGTAAEVGIVLLRLRSGRFTAVWLELGPRMSTPVERRRHRRYRARIDARIKRGDVEIAAEVFDVSKGGCL